MVGSWLTGCIGVAEVVGTAELDAGLVGCAGVAVVVGRAEPPELLLEQLGIMAKQLRFQKTSLT